MALTEERVLKSVEVLLDAKSINVCWENRVLRDGEVIAQSNERCAYGLDQKEQFIADVEGAAAFVTAIPWWQDIV